MDSFYLYILAESDLNTCADAQENNMVFLVLEYHTLEVESFLYCDLSLPWPFRMLQEDHLCNHLYRFHTYSSEADVVEEGHGQEGDRASSHGVYHAFHDVEADDYKLEVNVLAQLGVMQVYVEH